MARPTAVVLAGDGPGVAELVASVVEPVLAGFPVDVIARPAAPRGPATGKVLAELMAARIVVADVVGASPEVLLGITRRGRALGRTVLLAPEARGATQAADVLRHPPSAEGVRAGAAGLSGALHEMVLGDRAGAADQAEAVLADVLGVEATRRAALRRIESGVVPVADQADVALGALCHAYGALGAWTEVVRLADGAIAAGGPSDGSGLPTATVWVYAVSLNRVERGKEAEKLLEARLARDGANPGLYAALGRVHKDRSAAGGRGAKGELAKALEAYRAGFDVDDNYYPGINALTLLVVGGGKKAEIDDLVRRIRASVARGRNADEHPWWYWASRVQVEAIAGDIAAANQALDGLLSQPSEDWMRASTAEDLARIAEARQRADPTAPEEIADSDVVRGILEIRQAVLDRTRPSRRGMPPHSLLEITRRGEDRWVNFTSAEPSPLFCRAKRDDGQLGESVLFGDPVARLREPGADQDARKGTMESVGSQLAEAFELTESSLLDQIDRDADKYADSEKYLVLQLDENTAIEPWELFAQEPGRYLSIETTLARRLWLGTGVARRRSGAPTRRALVIGDPRDDLPAARQEASQVRAQLEDSGVFPAGVVQLIGKGQATARGVAKVLDEGGIDLLHYAGHALGVEDSGGLLLADDTLRPDTLAAAVTTPVIVVANACSSGELGGDDAGPHRATFVTALTRAGVGIYVGCAWAVGDAQARAFSLDFYSALLAGETVGLAVKRGRQAIRLQFDFWDASWGAYVLYGNPWYQLVQMPAVPPVY